MWRRAARTGLLVVIAVAGLTASAPPPAVVRIGMLKGMFRDVPAPMLQAMAAPLQAVIEQQTGIKAQVVMVESAEVQSKQLADGFLQLGVYHGFEFAWMRLRQPTLEPLMQVSANPNMLQSVVVVANSNPAKSICECRGQKMVVPSGAREHSRLFLNRQCRKHGGTMQEFFPVPQGAPSLEDALDDVVEGVAQVAVVEQVALQMYQRRKPGRFARIKTLSQSEPFPPSVIAYERGGLDEASLQRFRDGMSSAHKTTLGNHLMGMMKINGFEPVPANFSQRLADTLKAYPPPG